MENGTKCFRNPRSGLFERLESRTVREKIGLKRSGVQEISTVGWLDSWKEDGPCPKRIEGYRPKKVVNLVLRDYLQLRVSPERTSGLMYLQEG